MSISAKVGADLTLPAKVVAKLAGISVNGLVNDATGALERAVNSSEYLGPVGEYLTEAFVQLAERGHKFHALEVSGSDFVVVHFDPKAAPGEDGGIIDDSPRPADPVNEILPPRPKRSTEFVAGLERLNEIETIVVLMQENRSFDHMLGYLSLPGGNRKNGQPIEGKIDGLAGLSNATTHRATTPPVSTPSATRSSPTRQRTKSVTCCGRSITVRCRASWPTSWTATRQTAWPTRTRGAAPLSVTTPPN